MGIAAYNRGSAAISAQIDADIRPLEFEIMDRLNGLEKYPDAGTPFATIHFVFDDVHGMWWALDAKKLFNGFGFYYRTLNEAVRRWRVTVVGFDKGHWIANPPPKHRL